MNVSLFFQLFTPLPLFSFKLLHDCPWFDEQKLQFYHQNRGNGATAWSKRGALPGNGATAQPG
jgi:hypothetical protein